MHEICVTSVSHIYNYSHFEFIIFKKIWLPHNAILSRISVS